MTPWNCPKGYGVCWTCARPCNEPVVPDMALRSEPAQPVASKRDTDWILAIGAALGMDSGFSIPIVPEVEPFRQLFAALRASPPPQPAPEVAELARRLLASKHDHYECEDCWYSCATICCDESRKSDKCDCGATEENALKDEAASALSARRVSEAEAEIARSSLWRLLTEDEADTLGRAVLRLAGGEHG